MGIARIIVLGGIVVLQATRAFRLLAPTPQGRPRVSPSQRLGQRVGVLAMLATVVGLAVATASGVGWTTVALSMVIALNALRPARHFGRGVVQGIWPDDRPDHHATARVIGAGAAFVPAVSIPIWILVRARPGLPMGWVAAAVGLAVAGAIVIRQTGSLRLLVPEVWPDETFDAIVPCLDHLLGAPTGAVLSVSQGGRRILGFQRVSPPGPESYSVEFVLWDAGRPEHQLSNAVEEIGSAGFLMEMGRQTPVGSPAQRCRVRLAGDAAAIREGARTLAEATRQGFELAESVRLRYTLARDAKVDFAIHARPVERP